MQEEQDINIEDWEFNFDTAFILYPVDSTRPEFFYFKKIENDIDNGHYKRALNIVPKIICSDYSRLSVLLFNIDSLLYLATQKQLVQWKSVELLDLINALQIRQKSILIKALYDAPAEVFINVIIHPYIAKLALTMTELLKKEAKDEETKKTYEKLFDDVNEKIKKSWYLKQGPSLLLKNIQ